MYSHQQQSLSPNEKRRRIYSMVFLYLVFEHASSRLRDLFLETESAVNECKERALQLLQARRQDVDFFRLREPANWTDFHTHVVQRAFRTADAEIEEVLEFAALASESLQQLIPDCPLDFVAHARAEIERALRGSTTEDARAALHSHFDLGGFLSVTLQHPLQPITAVSLRDAIRSIDAVKLAQLTLENRGMNHAIALRRMLENELLRNRRAVESPIATLGNRVPREYMNDTRLRDRVADSTDEVDRVVLHWSAALAQRLATYAALRPLLDRIQLLRAQINDSVSEVLSARGGEVLLQLIMSNDEQHEIRLVNFEAQQQRGGLNDREQDDEEEEEEYEAGGGAALDARLRSFAAILGDYGDAELNSVYAAALASSTSSRLQQQQQKQLQQQQQQQQLTDISQEETQARLERIFQPAPATGLLPALPVHTVRDAMDASVNELVSSIAARRLQTDADSQEVVHASASILLGLGGVSPGNGCCSVLKRPRADAAHASEKARRAAAADAGFRDVDTDLISYTNAELLRAVLQRDMLVQALEERIFSCIVSPKEMKERNSSALSSIVRDTRARMQQQQRSAVEQFRAQRNVFKHQLQQQNHGQGQGQEQEQEQEQEDDLVFTAAGGAASSRIAPRRAATSSLRGRRATVKSQAQLLAEQMRPRFAQMTRNYFTPRTLRTCLVAAQEIASGVLVCVSSVAPSDSEQRLEMQRQRQPARNAAYAARQLIRHSADNA